MVDFQKIPFLKITYCRNCKITFKTGGIFTRWGEKRLLKSEEKT